MAEIPKRKELIRGFGERFSRKDFPLTVANKTDNNGRTCDSGKFRHDDGFPNRVDGFDEDQIHAALDEVIHPLGVFGAEFFIGRDKVGR